MKNLLLLVLLGILISCGGSQNADEIVSKAIAKAGGDHLNNTDVEFIFRNKEYGAKHQGGNFEYVRIFKDSSNLVHDVLSNDGFLREVNGNKVDVPDSMVVKYSNALNSVIYFALLPIKLDDEAVVKQHLGEKVINEKSYHKIRVSFAKEGGGSDFNDVFIYWINKKTNYVDYLAYEYETDGGGKRFRVAYNEREIGGIRFVNYINYKPITDIALDKLDEVFDNDEMEEISRIELQNIKVNKLK